MPDAHQRDTDTTTRAAARFLGLDALRGVAAFAVVLYHVGTAVGLSWLAPNGYLAVDFFFALSGFVIAHAYGARLASGALRPLSFLVLRFVRLWPTALLGSLLGFVVVLSTSSGAPIRSSPAFAAVAALNVILVPNVVPGALGLYPLNPPHWSLFYEIAGNFAYAVGARALAGLGLTLLVLATSLVVVVDGVRHAGAGVAPAARLAFAFSGGVVAYRMWRSGLRPKLDLAPLLALLGIALFTPASLASVRTGTGVVLAMVSFPLLVWVGASTSVNERSAKLAAAAGELSYPLYAIHYPLVLLASDHVAGIAAPVVATCAVTGTVALSALCLVIARCYDRPIRTALRRESRRNRNRVPGIVIDGHADLGPEVTQPIAIWRDFATSDSSQLPWPRKSDQRRQGELEPPQSTY